MLNVNELANALKPAVLPGENLRVKVIREGKEAEQGVGYLNDGTMIVIEAGARAARRHGRRRGDERAAEPVRQDDLHPPRRMRAPRDLGDRRRRRAGRAARRAIVRRRS